MEGKVECSVSFSVPDMYFVIGDVGRVFKLVSAVLVVSVDFRNNNPLPFTF